MAASPANIIRRAITEDRGMTTEELIRTFMLAGYGLEKAKKHIVKFAENGLISQTNGAWFREY